MCHGKPSVVLELWGQAWRAHYFLPSKGEKREREKGLRQGGKDGAVFHVNSRRFISHEGREGSQRLWSNIQGEEESRAVLEFEKC